VLLAHGPSLFDVHLALQTWFPNPAREHFPAFFEGTILAHRQFRVLCGKRSLNTMPKLKIGNRNMDREPAPSTVW
jgi:hypothetical protein